MPHRNRVTPFNEIVADPARGGLMGNRGCLHDDDQNLIRGWTTKRWIACLLQFKGRRRTLMQPGRYTELFFLDEPTALAAGHRPCAECRWSDFRRFRQAWAEAHGCPALPVTATDMDKAIHADRLEGRRKRVYRADPASLPDGCMVADGKRAFLIRGGALHPWSCSGYGAAVPIRAGQQMDVLTPLSIVRTLYAGYRPAF